MTPFSDQLTAVRQAQLEAQLDMFRKLSARALESAGQLAALNMRATRTSMEQATGTVKQLLEVRDPRDLFALGSAAQAPWQAMFSYGRELFGLTVGARGLPAQLLAAPAPTANVPTNYSQIMEQASIATADATTITGEIAAAAVDIGAAHAEAAIDAGKVAPIAARTDTDAEAAAEAAIETAIAGDVPSAEPTALAKALNEVAPKPPGVEHPLASTVPLEAAEAQVELPVVTPPDSIAPATSVAPKASRGPRKR
jgi:phasin family protein